MVDVGEGLGAEREVLAAKHVAGEISEIQGK